MIGTVPLKRSVLFFLGAGLGIVGMVAPFPAGAVNLGVNLAAHKAIYDIRLVSAKNGAPILDVRGKMLYTLRTSCDGYISDHRFNLNYEYASAPPVQVETKFTSFEGRDGQSLSFSSNRMSNGELDQELRGKATLSGGEAIYSRPADLSFPLQKDTLFPAAHTIRLIEAAEKGQKLFHAPVFDGSDDKGPVEINAVIGKELPVMVQPASPRLDKTLVGVPGWRVRLAVFPEDGETQDVADYEMTMDLLENGVVQQMVVDYHDFSVSQKLVAIEPVAPDEECGVR